MFRSPKVGYLDSNATNGGLDHSFFLTLKLTLHQSLLKNDFLGATGVSAHTLSRPPPPSSHDQRRPAGTAFVTLISEADAVAARAKHRAMLSNRWVEVYKFTPESPGVEAPV